MLTPGKGAHEAQDLLISAGTCFRVPFEEALMRGLFLLSEAQIARIAPHFPLVHSVPRVDDWRVVSGIVHVITANPS